jgi:hypothetical protein
MFTLRMVRLLYTLIISHIFRLYFYFLFCLHALRVLPEHACLLIPQNRIPSAQRNNQSGSYHGFFITMEDVSRPVVQQAGAECYY